jgi:diaminohydroxyphosphoribosylaminopyrimidine deaminase/5-amino-6-(5-phosphoribosylamino)uracil reductase
MSNSRRRLDEHFMRMALSLAERGTGLVSPNPKVGCVLVKEGAVVGWGYHKYFGGPHAEIMALDMAGRDASGSTAYVSLEPCSHWG